MTSHYQMFAGYNAWCNERLYAAAASFDLIVDQSDTSIGMHKAG